MYICLSATTSIHGIYTIYSGFNRNYLSHIISSLSTAAEAQSLLIRVTNRSNQYGVYFYDLNTELCTHHI